MGRSPCCSKEGLNRGAWTAMEDKILSEYIKIHGEGKWRNLPKRAGLKRCGKSCRLRWLNYLRPDIKRGNITRDEEELIVRLHKLLGNRWSLIAGRLPGRTDNEIKNYWNTNIGKKIQGHPNPTPKRPSSQAPAKPSPTAEGSATERPQANPGSCVVRTKATRCTRVVVPSGPQVLNHFEAKQVADPSVTHDPVDFSKSFSEELNLSSLMMDFEMNGGFLSDFLNMDFSQLSCLENEGDTRSKTCDQGLPSLTSDQTLLVSEDMQHGSDSQPVTPFTDSGLEWLCD